MTQDATFTLTLLGTGAACPPPERENTSIALQWPGGIWLIDCGASPHRRLRQAGLDPGRLRGVVITHGHPDHLYGLPSLVHCLLPAPRSETLPLLAPPLTLARARAILDAFDLSERDELPLDFVEIPLDAPPSTPIIEVDELALYTAEVQHSQEAVGVRAEAGGRVLAYTGDTMPCEGVEALAGGSHTLVHEATFLTSAEVTPGHSTARDAGLAAQRAGVETLILVHFLEETARDLDALAKEAADVFDGRVIVGEDMAHYAI